jgi:hypothetical protein
LRNFRATAESLDLDRGGSDTAHNQATLRQSITRPDQEAATDVLPSGPPQRPRLRHGRLLQLWHAVGQRQGERQQRPGIEVGRAAAAAGDRGRESGAPPAPLRRRLQTTGFELTVVLRRPRMGPAPASFHGGFQ